MSIYPLVLVDVGLMQECPLVLETKIKLEDPLGPLISHREARHGSIPPKHARQTQTVGTIISRDPTPKFLKFGVDDGTGCVTCVMWLNHLTSSYHSRRDPSTVLLLASAARNQAAEIRIGTVARVRGRLGLYRGVMQITASDVVVERDPNAEILHWLECLRLSRSSYRIQS
ncbi:CST complex subunit STN1 [Cardamine amara subsp. amara]|uniref:CST complex subunit STN1 n=1 Tax=Cardamine amara subsp. amara TaxID=228776 RepID=A0ABD1ADI0_CARAN